MSMKTIAAIALLILSLILAAILVWMHFQANTVTAIDVTDMVTPTSCVECKSLSAILATEAKTGSKFDTIMTNTKSNFAVVLDNNDKRIKWTPFGQWFDKRVSSYVQAKTIEQQAVPFWNAVALELLRRAPK